MTPELQWQMCTQNGEMISDLFYGQMRTKTNCYKCKYENVTFELFSFLAIELPQSGEQCGLIKCMDRFFGREIISDCRCSNPNCETLGRATRILDIFHQPQNLVILFKRYISENSSQMRKCEANVHKVFFVADSISR